MKHQNVKNNANGITLIALIITIIVMLILVAVTVRTVIQSGLFGHAGQATSGYSMHEAREELGTTLAGAMAEKYTNKDYNEDDFLDEYIKDNLPGSQIAGDVVLVDGWAFELDRSVPEIVNDLGKGNPEDFKSPELTVTKGTLAEDKLSIPLNITALEATNGISKIEVYKVGEKDPIETFTCSNETTAVNKTFTATENAKYKIVAYSKLRATKTIEVTEIVPPSPTAQDAYVRYTPDTAGNYTVPTSSGYSVAQSIPQDTTLKWKVLSLNEDGTIDLIADRPISTNVFFQVTSGYNNGVYLLDDLCKSQYSNASLGATARSIDLVDIEKHFNDAGRAARDASTCEEVRYGDTKAYSGNFSYAPHAWINNDKNVSKISNNIAQMESEPYYSTATTETSTQVGNITVTQTGYSITSQASYYDDPNFHTLIFGTGKNFWLASRFTNCDSFATFGLRFVNGDRFNTATLYDSFNRTHIYSYCLVRPVVSLGSNFKLQQDSGTTEWEIVRK